VKTVKENRGEHLQVAIVGLGVGEQHARAFDRNQHSQIRWLCDFDLEKADRVRNDIGCQGALLTCDIDEVLNDPVVDVVSIASYDDHHYNQVLDSLNAGKHTFVEKPLCRGMEELSKIKELWDSRQPEIKLQSNLVLRAAPLYKWLQHVIKSGDFGNIYSFDGEYLYGRLSKLTHGWRKNVRDYSVLEGGGIHLIDLMLWLVRENPVEVFAVGNKIATQSSEFVYNDFATSIMQFPSGLVGRITANFGCVHQHQHVMRVYGTNKTFLYDDSGARTHENRDPDDEILPVSLQPLPSGKGDLIDDFVNSILDKRDVTERTQAIFDAISICAASDKSMKTGRPEKINYV